MKEKIETEKSKLQNTGRFVKRGSKSFGQSMVEFALVLPILLTLIYGVLETGRLLFIYSSAVTASRQAVRYGSATGISPNGIPYFQDCDGIVAAARKVAFINKFETIDISYDGGLNASGSPVPLSSPDPACGSYEDLKNGDRIKVEVVTQWEPIVRILPFKPFEIVSESERTILVSVAMEVTAAPSGWDGSGSGLADLVSVLPSSPSYDTPGQAITYTYNLHNIGSGDLSSPTVVDSMITATCADSTVAADTNYFCTGTYTITQADLDNGSVTSSAYPGTSPTDIQTTTITAIQSPALALTKNPWPTESSIVGEIITYTYTLTNSGNVTLKAPFSVADDKIPVSCSGAPSTLAPGVSTTCTGTHAVTQANINDKSIVNYATASAIFGTSTVTSNTASALVLTPPLYLVVSQSTQSVVATGEVITYTYSMKNISAGTITGWNIDDNRAVIDCSSASGSIASGATTTCTGTYTVSQDDMDAGSSLESSVTVTGNLEGQPISSNTVSTTVTISQTSNLLAIVGVALPDPDPVVEVNDVLTYTYVLTNSGNVTLEPPFSVNDDKVTVSCTDQTHLHPGHTRHCTGTYTVKVEDANYGSITNHGHGRAHFKSSQVDSSETSATVATFSGPRFELQVSADKSVVATSGEQITYTYTFKNTGGTNLSDYAITSSLGTAYPSSTLDCSLADPVIPPGSYTSCKSTYTVTSTGTITNDITAATAKNGAELVNASSLPVPVTTQAYICNASNLRYTASPASAGNGSKTVIWTASNTVGTSLPIASITIAWSGSGNGASSYHLDSVALSNSSSVALAGLPDNISSHISGSGTLNSGSTDITLTFSKNDVTGVSIMITFQSPYGACHLP